MTIRVGVNGFGRIGKACVRLVHEHPELSWWLLTAPVTLKC